MRILWVTPSFSDHRIAVYVELNRLIEGKLTLVYSKTRTPKRLIKKIEQSLVNQAIGLRGEKYLRFGDHNNDMANMSVNIPFQPGLFSTVLKLRADVTVAEGFFQWTPAVILKRVLQRTPLVVSYQKTAHTERNCPKWRILYRKAMVKLVNAMVCNGVLSKEYSQSLGMSPTRITVGGRVADVPALRKSIADISMTQCRFLQTQFGLTEPVFLYVGRMIPLKGVAELLHGWEAYKNQESGHGSLLLVGEGDQLDFLQRWAKERELKNVYFTGGVDYENIAQYYASADVFIIATLEDNWSLVVPEAMACGLPIACSKYNGCWPELIKTGENGVIFDPFEPEDVSNSLKFFSDHRDDLEDMGKVSQRIVAEFSPRHAAQAVLKACEIALRRHRGE